MSSVDLSPRLGADVCPDHGGAATVAATEPQSHSTRRSFLFRAIRSVAGHPLREHIFALRYEVYCLECGFLPAEDYEDGLEFDEYDEFSAHFTAHDLTNQLAGSVRLVRPPADMPFPFEEHCHEMFPGLKLPPKEMAGEISRLVVRQKFRRRVGDTLAGVPQQFFVQTTPPLPGRSAPNERRSNSPEILLGLYREMYRYSRAHGVRYWYAAMERSLARALGRLDFVFHPIGKETDYYGPVTPYLADLRDLEDRLRGRNPAMLEWFTSGD